MDTPVAGEEEHVDPDLEGAEDEQVGEEPCTDSTVKDGETPNQLIFDDARDELVERATQLGVRYRVESDQELGTHELVVSVKNLEQDHDISVNPIAAPLLTEVDFGDIVKLGEYNAVFRPRQKSIEACIRSALGPSFYISRRLQNLPNYEADDRELSPGQLRVYNSSSRARVTARRANQGDQPVTTGGWRLTLEGAGHGVARASIGPRSDIIAGLGIQNGRDDHLPGQRLPSLLLEGVDAADGAAALRVLESVASSILFELDATMGVTASLERSVRVRVGSRARRRPRREMPLQFPRLGYSREAVSLYMQGRSTQDMPLLQYLTYYQAIEHLFPTFTRAETLRRLRARVQDPRFEPNNEIHLNNLLLLAQSATPSAMREREQLQATLESSIDVEDLKSFIEESPEMKENFQRKNRPAKGFEKLSVNSPTFLIDVVNRISDLRNRIVHTKTDRDPDKEAIYPQTPESRQMREDIELIEKIAKEVIIVAASTK